MSPATLERLQALHEELRQEAIEAEMDAERIPDHHRYYVGRLDGLSVALVLLQNVIDEATAAAE